MRVFLCASIAALLGGCVTPNQEQIGSFPTNYRALIRDHVKKAFYDPYSMRDVGIAAPQQGHVMFQQGWVVCFRANAKNRLGAYTGLKYTGYLVRNNEVLGGAEDFADCEKLTYQPFPELESR